MAKRLSLENSVVLVTGASGGIGRRLVLDFAARGATVVGCARSEKELQATLAEAHHYRADASVYVCDVRDPHLVHEMVKEILAERGRIDILVNNAGHGTYASFIDQETETIEGIMRTNFLGAVHCIKEVLPRMVERRSGHIVNISSVAGQIGSPNMASYCASKFALNGLSESLYHELRPFGVFVSLVCPGQVATRMPLLLEQEAAGVRLPTALALTAEDVSGAVIRSIEKRRFAVAIPLWLAWICRLKGLAPNLFQLVSHYALRMRLARSPSEGGRRA
jgi:uncharacterized protein